MQVTKKPLVISQKAKELAERNRIDREAQESYYMAEALERAEREQAWREEQQWIMDEINH